MEIATPPTIIFRVAALCVSRCQSAFKFGSDAISMMFTVAQVAPINLA